VKQCTRNSLGGRSHYLTGEFGLLRADGRRASTREKRLVSLAMTVALLSLPNSLALAKHRRPHVIRHTFVFMPTGRRGGKDFPPGILCNQRTRSARRDCRTRFLGRTPGVKG
jgi:hypothetical protein